MLSLLYGPTLTPIHDYWKNHSFDYTDQNDILFIIRDWNAKVGSQEIPGVTGKFGLGVQNAAGQRLTEFCTENALIIANTVFQQETMLRLDITTWTSPHGHHHMDITKSHRLHHHTANTKSHRLHSLQPKMKKLYMSAKTRPGADCGSDHELLTAKFRLKLKKGGKTT